MPNIDNLKKSLTKKLGFAKHHIDDGGGEGVAAETKESEQCHASLLVKTDQGNCYAVFRHASATMSESEANRY